MEPTAEQCERYGGSAQLGVRTHLQGVRKRPPLFYHKDHNHSGQLTAGLSKDLHQPVKHSLPSYWRSDHADSHSAQIIASPSRSDRILPGTLHLRHRFQSQHLLLGHPIATGLLPQGPPPHVFLRSVKGEVPAEDTVVLLGDGEA